MIKQSANWRNYFTSILGLCLGLALQADAQQRGGGGGGGGFGGGGGGRSSTSSSARIQLSRYGEAEIVSKEGINFSSSSG